MHTTYVALHREHKALEGVCAAMYIDKKRLDLDIILHVAPILYIDNRKHSMKHVLFGSSTRNVQIPNKSAGSRMLSDSLVGLSTVLCIT